MTTATLSSRVRAGDPRAVARAISLVENDDPASPALLAEVGSRTGRAVVVGVTGPPGVGKSTLVDRLIAAWRAHGQRVGVLAVDPSSPFSGGAILGDRVRMQGHAGDADVFIRSMATRGAPGGVARAAADATRILEGAGFDRIVIETVGVGQAEVDVVRLADLTVVVVVPGTGDDIQALKAGLMEVGDVFVVNKADREGTERAVAALEQMLSLDERGSRPWRPRVVATIASSGEGVNDLLAALSDFEREAPASLAARREARGARGPRADRLRLDHIGIAVDSPDRLLAFLREALGLTAAAAEDVPASGVRVHFVDTAGTALEIIEPAGSRSAIARFLETRGPGLHHLAFRVPDLLEALARLRAGGVRVIDETPRPGAQGSRVAFIHPSSAGGVLVELVEREDG